MRKKQRMIRFSIQVPVELYEAALSEAKDQAVSISGVIRWALKERYQRQLAQVREQQAGSTVTLIEYGRPDHPLDEVEG